MNASVQTHVLRCKALSVIAILSLLSVFSAHAYAQCPAFGEDTTCGVVITITSTGANAAPTGQGPYDGDDDTLVGVVNNSKIPITSLVLTGSQDIFGFDGDGIDTYGAPGNAQDSTGYGGPNAYFTNINSSTTTGTVNFITPIAPNGGTTYFSLENALGTATACTSILNGSVPTPTVTGANIDAQFTPQGGYNLTAAAQTCGFVAFDWQQKVLNLPLPSPFYQNGTPPINLKAPPTFFDPPFGGYGGNYSNPSLWASNFPFYYNYQTLQTACAVQSGGACVTPVIGSNGTVMNFHDFPNDSCLFGGNSSGVVGCNGKNAPKGSKIAFGTHLVGILPSFTGGSAVDCVAAGTCIDTGILFSWTSDYNGKSGGVATLTSVDIGPTNSENGGVVVIGYQGNTTYTGVAISAINGNPPSAMTPSLESGSKCNGTYTGPFTGDILVSFGQTCTLVGADIVGNIYNVGGTLSLNGTAVDGNVISSGGSVDVSSFTAITQDLIIGETSQSTMSQVCGSTIYGSLNVTLNFGEVQVGTSQANVCSGNVVGGWLTVEGNKSATVFNNTITDDLVCGFDRSISGGGNVASRMEGQCHNF